MVGLKKSELIYAVVILAGLGASIYFLGPALSPRQIPGGPGTVITTPNEYPPVEVLVLKSTDCKTQCFTGKIESYLRNELKNAKISAVFIESPQGKALVDYYNLSLVPAYLISRPQLLQSPALSTSARFLKQLDDDFYLLDTLETKSGFIYGNNKSAFPSLELYVAAFDFNSLRAENATFNVLKRFNGSLNFTLRYATNYNNGSFSSLSGTLELVETVLQTCMVRSGSPFAFNAIQCRVKELLSCHSNSSSIAFCASLWQGCAATWNFTEESLTTCIRANNESILMQEVNATRHIGAVPTIVIGNRYVIVGVPSEIELLSTLCAIYPGNQACVLNRQSNG